MFHHKQKKIVHPRTYQVISVDERLAKLIMALWEAKCETYCSCQDITGDGFGYIRLSDSRDPRDRATRKAALQLIIKIGALWPIWADVSPTDVTLRFKTRNIGKITRIITEDGRKRNDFI